MPVVTLMFPGLPDAFQTSSAQLALSGGLSSLMVLRTPLGILGSLSCCHRPNENLTESKAGRRRRWWMRQAGKARFSKGTFRQGLSIRTTKVVILWTLSVAKGPHGEVGGPIFRSKYKVGGTGKRQTGLTWSKSPFSITSSSISGVGSSSRKGLVDGGGDSSFFC